MPVRSDMLCACGSVLSAVTFTCVRGEHCPETGTRANRKKALTARDSEGNAFRWSFWRDERNPATWMLQDHTGYVRTLERTWIDSVPRIHSILQGHGLTADIS